MKLENIDSYAGVKMELDKKLIELKKLFDGIVKDISSIEEIVFSDFQGEIWEKEKF